MFNYFTQGVNSNYVLVGRQKEVHVSLYVSLMQILYFDISTIKKPLTPKYYELVTVETGHVT